MSELNLSTMSRDELEQTASDLGVSYPHNISDDKLRAKIAEHLGEPTEITTSNPSKASGLKAEILIPEHERDKQPVQVGVNGKMWLIQRGKKVIVPAKVVHALEIAVTYEYDPKDMARREVPRHPFQIFRWIEA